MYKIFMSVRNRLAITKKAVRAIELHSKLPYQLYIYDNQSNYLLQDHFDYYFKLYSKGRVTQVTFNTKESTFNAFSKASACSAFGAQHQHDPNKNGYDFLVFLDNDVIVTPEWDKILKRAWKDVKKYKLNNVKIIGQRPGGIKNGQRITNKIAGYDAVIGKLGGSALWCVKTNFFDDVGFLNLKELINQNKRHDQLYWRKISMATRGERYIMGLQHKLGIHCGSMAGSTCNILSKNKNGDISFKNAEEKISKMKFDEFYNKISEDRKCSKDW